VSQRLAEDRKMPSGKARLGHTTSAGEADAATWEPPPSPAARWPEGPLFPEPSSHSPQCTLR